jgi:hypothetical protein
MLEFTVHELKENWLSILRRGLLKILDSSSGL